jgi:site-specific recombinase XerD
MMPDKISRIARQVEDYIAYKRSLGFKITIEAEELRRFSKFADTAGHSGAITSDIAINWACDTKSRKCSARRLETVGIFAKYAACVDPEAQVPPRHVFGKAHGRTTPYIFDEDEVLLLMEAANNLYTLDNLRPIAVATVLGLLWSTGMRVSESIRLAVRDVQEQDSVILVKETKFGKSRLVTLDSSVMSKLTAYRKQVEELSGSRDLGSPFFVTSGGRALTLVKLEYAFKLIRPVLLADGMLKWSERPPRLADFRHSFACHTIARWLEAGVDIEQKIYSLSVYMGHVKPEDTYWYLSATPKLLKTAVCAFEDPCEKRNNENTK